MPVPRLIGANFLGDFSGLLQQQKPKYNSESKFLVKTVNLINMLKLSKMYVNLELEEVAGAGRLNREISPMTRLVFLPLSNTSLN